MGGTGIGPTDSGLSDRWLALLSHLSSSIFSCLVSMPELLAAHSWDEVIFSLLVSILFELVTAEFEMLCRIVESQDFWQPSKFFLNLDFESKIPFVIYVIFIKFICYFIEIHFYELYHFDK